MKTQKVTIDALPYALKKMLDLCMKHNKELVAKKFADAPLRFKEAALDYYPLVLHVRHGFLRNAIKELARTLPDGRFDVGLSNRMEYALVQEAGFDGMVTVKEHMRKVKGVRISYVDFNTLKTRTRTTKRFTFVRTHQRHMRIIAKYFLSHPIIRVAREFIYELQEEIGFAD